MGSPSSLTSMKAPGGDVPWTGPALRPMRGGLILPAGVFEGVVAQVGDDLMQVSGIDPDRGDLRGQVEGEALRRQPSRLAQLRVEFLQPGRQVQGLKFGGLAPGELQDAFDNAIDPARVAGDDGQQMLVLLAQVR